MTAIANDASGEEVASISQARPRIILKRKDVRTPFSRSPKQARRRHTPAERTMVLGGHPQGSSDARNRGLVPWSYVLTVVGLLLLCSLSLLLTRVGDSAQIYV